MAYTYRGFSSVSGKTENLYDQELINQGLLNHFNTKKGERIGDCDYGFIGWDLLFELDKADNLAIIREDVSRIIASDIRVRELSTEVIPIEYGYYVHSELEYLDLGTVGDLTFNFTQTRNPKLK